MYVFKLPDLGEGIHEGEVLKWHVSEGEVIEVDAPLVDIETDKAAVTIPSPAGGEVLEINGAVGDLVTVGSVLVVIEDGQGERKAPMKVSDEAAPRPAVVDAAAPQGRGGAVVHHGSGPVPAAPATRRLARELGVHLKEVPATGPAGRVTREDVERFAAGEVSVVEALAPIEEAQDASPAPLEPSEASGIPFYQLKPTPDFSRFGPVKREPMRSIRRKTAQRVVTAMTVVPHVAHMDEADVTELERLRRGARISRADEPGGRLTLLPFIVKAVCAGLRDFPQFNASVDPVNEEIIYKQYFNMGFAADTARGLVVPVIKGCEQKNIMGISADVIRLGEKARAGGLEPDDMQGGCFTITNVGAIGGTGVIPTINYPEVAILGMGRVQEKPVVRDGEIVIRKMLPLTLAFDHRVADGAAAAHFVTQLTRRLSDPYALLLEI